MAQWRNLARSSPDEVIDHFLAGLTHLPEEQSKALFAAIPERERIRAHLPAALSPGEEARPLFGVPFLLQDLFDVEGVPSRCGARLDEILDHPAESSSLLHREVTEQGAWFAGKLAPVEFGIDLRGRAPMPGGGFIGAGGAASCAEAVARGLAPLAFGLDTTGGLRGPAACRGVFAYRMGHNRLAREGVFPVAPSLDAIGWITARADEMAAVLRAMYQLTDEEEMDRECHGCYVGDLGGALEPGFKAAAMSIVRELSLEDGPWLQGGPLAAFRAAGNALSVLAGRELYSVHRYWLEEYGDRYDPEVARVIRRGMDRSLVAADEAGQVRDKVTAAFSSLFEDYDYLVFPAVSSASPRVSEWTARAEAEMNALLAPVSLSGLPALLLPVPCADGRSGGLQVVFNPRDKRIVLAVLASLAGFYGCGS